MKLIDGKLEDISILIDGKAHNLAIKKLKELIKIIKKLRRNRK